MIAAGPLSKRPPHIAFAGRSAWFATVGLALVLLLGSLPTISVADEPIKLGEFIPVTPPQPAPEVSFTDADGKPVRLTDFAGKPTIVNLWATWCQPCLKELPSLDRLQADLGSRLRVVEISEDRGGGKLVLPFVAALKLGNLKIYLDPKADLGHAFEVQGLPTSLVLDNKARVVGKVMGPADWDSSKMKGILVPFLSNGELPITHAQSGPVRPPG